MGKVIIDKHDESACELQIHRKVHDLYVKSQRQQNNNNEKSVRKHKE